MKLLIYACLLFVMGTTQFAVPHIALGQDSKNQPANNSPLMIKLENALDIPIKVYSLRGDATQFEPTPIVFNRQQTIDFDASIPGQYFMLMELPGGEQIELGWHNIHPVAAKIRDLKLETEKSNVPKTAKHNAVPDSDFVLRDLGPVVIGRRTYIQEYKIHVPVTTHREETYEVKVPYTELVKEPQEVKQEDGTFKTEFVEVEKKSMRTETRTRTVPVTTMRTETRSRETLPRTGLWVKVNGELKYLDDFTEELFEEDMSKVFGEPSATNEREFFPLPNLDQLPPDESEDAILSTNADSGGTAESDRQENAQEDN